MKTFFVTALCSFLLASCSLERDMVKATEIPAAVTDRFTSLHPTTGKAEWETEEDGSYEAEYKVEGREYSDTYSAAGDLLETEQELKKNDLPAAVLATLARDFAGHEIEEAARITYPDGRIVYEAELEGKDDAKFDALFTEDGTLVERVPLTEADRD